jgi:hypothetical protein
MLDHHRKRFEILVGFAVDNLIPLHCPSHYYRADLLLLLSERRLHEDICLRIFQAGIGTFCDRLSCDKLDVSWNAPCHGGAAERSGVIDEA